LICSFNDTKQKFIKIVTLALRADFECEILLLFTSKTGYFDKIYIIFLAKHGNLKMVIWSFLLDPFMAQTTKPSQKRFQLWLQELLL
jgi:hypothetical protein